MNPVPLKSQSWHLLAHDGLNRFLKASLKDAEPAINDDKVVGAPNVDFRKFADIEVTLPKVAAVALLARAFDNVTGLGRVLKPQAISLMRGRLSNSQLTWALRWIVPDDFEVFWRFSEVAPRAIRLMDVQHLASRNREVVSDIYDDLLETKDPVILVSRNDKELSPALQMLCPHEFDVGPIDSDILSIVFAVRYPTLTDAQIADLVRELPDLEAVGLDALEDLLLAFRQIDPSCVPAALTRYVNVIAKPEPVKPPRRSIVPLAEMVGLGKAKDAALDIVEALRDWKEGDLAWSAVPRGLLVAGPSGTGKTELARAMASEAGIHLVATSYNNWQKAGSLGDFLKAMERSFKEALSQAPSIIFIDELDAFYTRNELSGTGRNDSYDVKAIAALLERLDGMGAREGVVVVGACNHLEFVDPDIRRAGRFDAVVRLELPVLDDLIEILRQHLGGLSEQVDMVACAAAAVGKSGADCAAAVRAAGTLARRHRREVETADLLQALEGDLPMLSDQDWFRIAAHECGHAIVAVAIADAEVDFVRIGSEGGECKIRRKTELLTVDHLHAVRCVDLAGRAAEKVLFGSVTTGSGGGSDSDLARATRSAADQVGCFGMGEIGPVWMAPLVTSMDKKNTIDGHLPEIAQLLVAAEHDAVKFLRENRTLLVAMARELRRSRVLYGTALARYFIDLPKGAVVRDASSDVAGFQSDANRLSFEVV